MISLVFLVIISETHSSSCGISIRTLHVFAFLTSSRPGVELDQAVALEVLRRSGEFPPKETRCLSPELTFVIDLSVIPLFIRSLLAPKVLCMPDDPGAGPRLPPLLPSDLSVPILLVPGVKGVVCCRGGDWDCTAVKEGRLRLSSLTLGDCRRIGTGIDNPGEFPS